MNTTTGYRAAKAHIHPSRRAAEVKYAKALAARRAAESDTDESTYLAAEPHLTAARNDLVQAEIDFPTPRERRRQAARLFRANRGFID